MNIPRVQRGGNLKSTSFSDRNKKYGPYRGKIDVANVALSKSFIFVIGPMEYCVDLKFVLINGRRTAD